MAIFKATVAVSVMSRRLRRSFEKDEKVTEAELEMVVEHFRKCFALEPETAPGVDPAPPVEVSPE